MKKLLAMVFVAFTALGLIACGERVEVPPAHVGKIMTKDGYQNGMVGTSKFRLPPCMNYCDKLVIMDVSDKPANEPLEIFIPTDKLKMRVNIRTTLSLNPERIESLFNTLTPVALTSKVDVIPWDKIYVTYAKQIIESESREYLSKFSIAEISSNLDKMNSDLSNILMSKITKLTPFDVRYVGITNPDYPKIITDAQENAAQRREQIQQEEAQLQIAEVRLQRELKETRLQRQIDFEKAQGEAAAQKIQRDVVDDKVLKLRQLENERLWIEKWNGGMPQWVTDGGTTMQMMNMPQPKQK